MTFSRKQIFVLPFLFLFLALGRESAHASGITSAMSVSVHAPDHPVRTYRPILNVDGPMGPYLQRNVIWNPGIGYQDNLLRVLGNSLTHGSIEDPGNFRWAAWYVELDSKEYHGYHVSHGGDQEGGNLWVQNEGHPLRFACQWSDIYPYSDAMDFHIYLEPNIYKVTYIADTISMAKPSKESELLAYNQKIDLAVTATKPGWKFLGWDTDTNMRQALSTMLMPDNDVTLYGVWDKYPELEVSNRIFTLEQAKKGGITEAELLKKVIGTDWEDGALQKGTSVRVQNFNSNIFLNLSSETNLQITYIAKDSVGNIAQKTATIQILDTTAQGSKEISYIRYISKDFYKTGDTYITPERGGLEENSIWKLDSNYEEALKKALRNNPSESMETWDFSAEAREKVKNFIETEGYGRYRNNNATEIFHKQFSK